jgi:choline dehydrogenase-like flavoprotein
MTTERRAPYLAERPEEQTWDVVVIGTGMGGATLGYALARGGRRVLFIERGPLRRPPGDASSEPSRLGETDDNSPRARLERGEWPLPLEGETSLGEVKFFAPLGCGAGGSTTLYAAALERFRPVDFRPRANFPNAPDSTLPESWPITYDELAPYYDQAESLFRVCGTQDPLGDASVLREPPPASARDEQFIRSWTDVGLHPYRIHVGCEFVYGCEQCLGLLCPRNCKSDAMRICLTPALLRHGAKILPDCEVTRLEADRERIKRVICRVDGREVAITGKLVVVAAGAWMTPALLLRSRSETWPEGVANRSGHVGRNLMLHASDLITVFSRTRTSAEGPPKTIAFNDFYVHDGIKLGTFQSLSGSDMVRGTVLWYLRSVVDRDPRWSRKVIRPALPVVALLATLYFKHAGAFAAIIEDLPYYENRVVPDEKAESGVRFRYTVPDELRERIAAYRKVLARALAPHRLVVLPADNINYGHVCGTCRFGDDPDASVLDRDNRAHDIENLYVADSSFFPSSGGTNPSLTIAANALRVADRILGGAPLP